MIYDLLAPIYDKVNEEIDYVKWADFIESITKKELHRAPELWLDLAAGTGKMTIELARRGCDIIGIDISPEMLDTARVSAEREELSNILWLCQDMRSFELYGTVDVTVCCLDSINHLTVPKDVKTTFNLVHNYLAPDGIFIFDVNGKSKFEKTYADNSYVTELDNSFCVWQNYYNSKTKICDFYITLFESEDGMNYRRYDECQRERMYTVRALRGYLTAAGFEFIGAYKDFDFSPADDKDERIYIVARCKK